jgi:hypothetical protein
MIGTFKIFSKDLLVIKSISHCLQGRKNVDAKRKNCLRKNVDASMKKNQNATLAAKRNVINAALMDLNALKTAKTQKILLE